MKKLLSAIIVLTMLLGLAACAKPAEKDSDPSPSPSASPVASPEGGKGDQPEETAEPSDEPKESAKPSEKPQASPTPKPTQKPTPTPAPTPTPTPAPALLSLNDIISSVQYEVELPKVGNIAVSSELFQNYLFIDYISGAEAIASEALIGSIAHSAVILKVPDGTDLEATRSSIEANANPRKWICVEAEKVSVKSASNASGNFIFIVMSNTTAVDAMMANFSYLMSTQPAKA